MFILIVRRLSDARMTFCVLLFTPVYYSYFPKILLMPNLRVIADLLHNDDWTNQFNFDLNIMIRMF